MFAGIVKGIGKVTALAKTKEGLHYGVLFPSELLHDLQMGASIAIDGVCQTAVEQKENIVFFDAIPETLRCTTLSHLQVDLSVNIERSLRLGEEIGGHLLSGHVCGTVQLESIKKESIWTLSCSHDWTKYLFPKGYVGLNGCSLTVVDVSLNSFSVHLIPETLKRTNLGLKEPGALLNLEIDAQTQATVDALERLLSRYPERFT